MAHLRIPLVTLLALVAVPIVARAAPIERRLYSDAIDASSFLWNDWNKYVENYHPNYVGDDDARTAWVEGSAGSGAGEWVRLQVTPLEKTTRLRLRIRNGYQKSKGLFAANARAKDVVVRLLPSNVERKATLADQDGWQELTIDQPSGPMRAVELQVGTAYEGTKYQDLCISDVQVFATSETEDNPAFEKGKRKELLAWRAARMTAAKIYSAGKVALPLYPSYRVTSTEREVDCQSCDLGDMLATAAADPSFKEWKVALEDARGMVGDLDRLPQVQLAPTAKIVLPVADGFERPTLDEMYEGWYQNNELRLPFIASASILMAEQLRVLEVKGTQTPTAFRDAHDRRCKKDVTWAKRVPSPEQTGPEQVRAVVIGRCGKVESRDGYAAATGLQLLVYGRDGRLALVVSEGAIDAYRWTMDGERAMVSGGHALLRQGTELDAVKTAP